MKHTEALEICRLAILFFLLTWLLVVDVFVIWSAEQNFATGFGVFALIALIIGWALFIYEVDDWWRKQ